MCAEAPGSLRWSEFGEEWALVSGAGWMTRSRHFNSKSASYLDLGSSIGVCFSKCINICVSYQGL